MTKDVIAMAREAGFSTGTRDYASGVGSMPFVTPIGGTCLVELEKFATLVGNAKLEEAAQQCEELFSYGALVIAEAIRAMKEPTT